MQQTSSDKPLVDGAVCPPSSAQVSEPVTGDARLHGELGQFVDGLSDFGLTVLLDRRCFTFEMTRCMKTERPSTHEHVY